MLTNNTRKPILILQFRLRKFRIAAIAKTSGNIKILFDLFPVVTTDHIFTSRVVIVFSLLVTIYVRLSVEVCSNKALIKSLDDTGLN